MTGRAPANNRTDDVPTYVVRAGKIRVNNPAHSLPLTLFLFGFTAFSLFALFIVPFDWSKIASRLFGEGLGKAFGKLITISFSDIDVTVAAFFESIWVAILATIYSAILGLAIGMLMARNITPLKILPPLFSAFFTFVRAVPSFIWVLLVLVCLGFGPGTGVVGICIHSTAFFARAFSQAFEEVDQGVIDALAATGSNKLKIFFSAVLPVSLTPLIAWLTMNFESNFGASSVLGMVGVGGIGYIISASFSAYKYGTGMLAILMVVTFTCTIEIAFNLLKEKLKL
jgi:phosphonate transport system permease protein